jgi:AcrR family transcriptional regulator
MRTSETPLLTGKREQRKAFTRGELLQAGRKLFSEKGLHESTVEDLTRMAGIAKGTLYQYYGSKEELILAVVAAGFHELELCLEERVRDARTLPDLVARVVDAHLDFFAENPDLMRIFHQVRGLLKFNHGRWQDLRDALHMHLNRLGDLLGSRAPTTQLDPASRRELAILLFGGVSGITSVDATMDPGALRPQSATGRTLTQAFVAMARTYLSKQDGRAMARLPVLTNRE